MESINVGTLYSPEQVDKCTTDLERVVHFTSFFIDEQSYVEERVVFGLNGLAIAFAPFSIFLKLNVLLTHQEKIRSTFNARKCPYLRTCKTYIRFKES